MNFCQENKLFLFLDIFFTSLDLKAGTSKNFKKSSNGKELKTYSCAVSQGIFIGAVQMDPRGLCQCLAGLLHLLRQSQPRHLQRSLEIGVDHQDDYSNNLYSTEKFLKEFKNNIALPPLIETENVKLGVHFLYFLSM